MIISYFFKIRIVSLNLKLKSLFRVKLEFEKTEENLQMV